MKLDAAELLAGISYAVDVTPLGCYYHNWRVAILAEYLAGKIAPELQDSLFYAGLLHDIGAVGARKHMMEYTSLEQETADPHIASHPRRSSVLCESILGLAEIGLYIRGHHEWVDGSGYPDGKNEEHIPLASQILCLADTVDISFYYDEKTDILAVLKELSKYAGLAWPVELWNEFLKSIANTDYLIKLRQTHKLPQQIKEMLDQHPLPDKLAKSKEGGVDRVLKLGAGLVHLKDPTTRGHSHRVARFAHAIAEDMGLSHDDTETVYQAGMLHDLGRLGVPTPILTKSGRLDPMEMGIVRTHCDMTARSINCLPDSSSLSELADYASHDHEHFDGNGYPDGLWAENIPLYSRIISVADAYDAVVATKNYLLLSPRKAIVQLKKKSGSQFDPEVIKSLLNLINRNALPDVSDIAA